MGAGLTYEGGANDRVRELDWFEVGSTNGDLESGPCATNASFNVTVIAVCFGSLAQQSLEFDSEVEVRWEGSRRWAQLTSSSCHHLSHRREIIRCANRRIK
jgi:hypothetical protein